MRMCTCSGSPPPTWAATALQIPLALPPLSQSATHTGACRTNFPRPRTRRVDPGSILRDQNKGLIRRPELGRKHQMLASVHHHIQYLICIYTSDQHWEVTPVWKSTKISVSGLFSINILRELSVLDA